MRRKTVVLLFGGKESAVPGAGRHLFEPPVLGRPLAAFVLETVCGLGPEAVIVLTGRRGAESEAWEQVGDALATKVPLFLLSGKPRKEGGKGETLRALAAAGAVLEGYPDRDVLAVPANMPLLWTRTLKTLLRAHTAGRHSLTFLSGPGSFGLAGPLVIRSRDAFPLLRTAMRSKGAAGFEGVARRLTTAAKTVGFVECRDPDEILAVCGPEEVGRAARLLQRRKNLALARRGVTLLDPSSAWIDQDVEVGARTVIYPCVVVEGGTRIGADGRIYPHVHLMNARLGDRVRVLSSTVIEDSVVEDDAQVGPFSRLRPKSRVCAGAKVGNFVEMKNTVFGPRSKAQHLSYLGDSQVGEGVNVGAGTITCNYDGFSKNPTRIGDGAFIGSGTELVAPVEIGPRAYVAAGSTITRNVAADSLAIGRARQVEKPGWVLEAVKRRKKVKRRGAS